ncbi:PREDICTED: O-acyltransferase WSD1 [Prunus dulcis]|uniref:PREDICTED: O-acyltransferase WSD1 n=1 Tax=Prunus dulcis TaxID=3755 RepID=A0A5E4FUK1_PRUDU|nr:PREDICTED: O-acyltransferase WSD1 [Prunus dulcis]
MVCDSHGFEHSHKTLHFDLDRHVIIVTNPITTSSHFDHKTAFNDYLANLSTSSRLSIEKPM